MKKCIPTLIVMILCTPLFAQDVSLELFAENLSVPVDLQHAGDERLFVVEKQGLIKIINPDGSVNPTPFLNIDPIVVNPTNDFDERGLLGLAFHPDYDTNGYFYVHYIDNSGDTQISRFSVSTTDPNQADDTTEFQIIDYVQPFPNHNGGAIAFGPNDGYLYISSGDGGSGGDPGNRAQNTTLLLGKLLRIDVDNPSGGNNYGIPADNPYAGSTSQAEEIWAYGLRNPWRFSFDPTNGDLWIGDVGQGEVEEINRAAGTDAELNYGWRCYEGSQPFNTAGCPDPSFLTFPIAEYSSGSGSGNCSVTGGYVYRGNVYGDIQGLYFYADVCGTFIATSDASGNVIDHGDFGGTWVSFGVDNVGEMYVVDLGGDIFKIQGGTLSNPDIGDIVQLAILPNPASDRIQLIMENDTIEALSIMDVKGSILFSEEHVSTSQRSVDVSTFTSGMYLVRVTSQQGGTLIKKLVIQ